MDDHRISGSDYLFPVTGHTLRNWLDDAVASSGIYLGSRRIVPHSLRYTFNGIMRSMAVPDSDIRKVTGHLSERMTDYYDQRDVALRISDVSRIPIVKVLP